MFHKLHKFISFEYARLSLVCFQIFKTKVWLLSHFVLVVFPIKHEKVEEASEKFSIDREVWLNLNLVFSLFSNKQRQSKKQDQD